MAGKFAHGMVSPSVAGKLKGVGDDELEWKDCICPFLTTNVNVPVYCQGYTCALFVKRKALFGNGIWRGCSLKRVSVNLE